MTPDEFNTALSRTRIDVRGRPAQAAYKVLVGGEKGNAAAQAVGITQPGVSRAVKLLRAASLRPDLPIVSAPSMTLAQFNAAVRLTKMNHAGRTVEACKQVLVDGVAQKVAAAAVHGNAPAVSRGCAKIIACANLQHCPICGHTLR